MKIETILSPSLFYQLENIEEKTVVVIDILRATSTISTILQNGASAVIPVREENEAKMYQDKGYLVGGERGGETIPGFDFGNSPFSYTPEMVKNKEVVLTTTNGTKCLDMASSAHTVITGAFLHLQSVIDFLAKEQRDTVLFCAGWKDRTNLEDSLFAGAVVQLLDAEFDDASLLCKQAYQICGNNLFQSLQNSNHFQRLAKKGVIKDIEYCCEIDLFDIVPVLQNGKLIVT